ncbi:uncharacterized protein JN550_003248 [Neoarthrinium moseri]|uniref:uncharacterized protein n=1 Tax=Neoarthrinium moseri TaxID=1658444 RepID=UPI001FDBB7A2|nr:uncharacterized protein JN550_003248 [Neoarthrinium moseri]KAI1873979.1 hypothetical protein JN550_003248 [Neoarthrinium moseri]
MVQGWFEVKRSLVMHAERPPRDTNPDTPWPGTRPLGPRAVPGPGCPGTATWCEGAPKVLLLCLGTHGQAQLAEMPREDALSSVACEAHGAPGPPLPFLGRDAARVAGL